jgi:Tfp pilus assembly protein PilV
MALTSLIKRTRRLGQQRGTSLIELLVAMMVLTVGILACTAVLPSVIGSNYRNRQQSNSTAIAQMVMEKIMSVPGGTSPTLTVTDCAGTANNVNTTGSAAGVGAPLLSSGDVNFSGAVPAGYSMSYTTCGTSGGIFVYDVRWNIRTPSGYVKLITVSAKLKSAGANLKMFSLPVTIRSISGLGS